MRKFFAFVILLIIGSGCLKQTEKCPYRNVNVKAPQSELADLQQYLSDNGITNAVQHSSNLYYEIIEPGSGAVAEVCSNIVIGYTGRLTSGAVFDESAQTVFVLGSLIDGWKIGIPLIKKGGKIRLYIPPSLAYGSNDVKDMNDNVVIPGNSILIFDVDLFDVYK